MDKSEMKAYTSFLGSSVDKEIKVLREVKQNIVSLDSLTTAQQIMASLAFDKPEMLPSHWSEKPYEQLYKRLSNEQRYALKIYLKPYMKYVYLLKDELISVSFLVFISSFTYISMFYLLEQDPNIVGNPFVSYENNLKKLYIWLFSFGSLTAAWLYRCFVMEEFRVIDIVYHFLISMALIYFGIPSSAEWLIFIVIVVEFGAVKIIVDSSNKDD
ncbi:hypothetical protein ACSMFS_22415 [Shewanella xiamenensis]|uniref:hypothetical protein n=1 Tax=Shewanella xiamenensis TaxID=332186 RepID=UPI003F1AFEBC